MAETYGYREYLSPFKKFVTVSNDGPERLKATALRAFSQSFSIPHVPPAPIWRPSFRQHRSIWRISPGSSHGLDGRALSFLSHCRFLCRTAAECIPRR